MMAGVQANDDCPRGPSTLNTLVLTHRDRLRQAVLIGSTLVGSWLGMQAVHELGHVLGAWLTGAEVSRVVLHPLTISRTDLAENPSPLIVVWAGPIVGVLLPLVLWIAAAALRLRIAFVLRFFAGFCLLANGLYLGVGWIDRIGDCGYLLRHGAQPWQMLLFGAATAPAGLWLWQNQGVHFGLGRAVGRVSSGATYFSLFACVALIALSLIVGDG
jgi:hypothetical protein